MSSENCQLIIVSSRHYEVGSKGTTVNVKETEVNYRGYKDLKVFQLSYKLAMEIFQSTKTFPKEEKYSLTDQIRRSSRSIAANIAEAWKKRIYPKMFVSKLVDAAGEAGETEVWIDVSKDCGYLPGGKYEELISGYDEVNRMLYGMMEKPEKFCIKGVS